MIQRNQSQNFCKLLLIIKTYILEKKEEYYIFSDFENKTHGKMMELLKRDLIGKTTTSQKLAKRATHLQVNIYIII